MCLRQREEFREGDAAARGHEKDEGRREEEEPGPGPGGRSARTRETATTMDTLELCSPPC